jgi:hypothetical protein
MIRRGASLVWAVVLCGVMMLVMGTMSAFIIKESRMSIRMDDSSRAYAAAESGLEWARMCLAFTSCKDSLSITTTTPYQLGGNSGKSLNDAKYYVTIKLEDNDNDGSVDDYTITSRGESNGVNRQLEHKYEDGSAELIDSDSIDTDNQRIPSGFVEIDGSFTLSFYYWANDASRINNSLFGIQNTTAKDQIAVSISDNDFDLSIIDYNSSLTFTDSRTDTNPNSTYKDPIEVSDSMSTPYSVLVELKYLRNTSARLTVMQYNETNGAYECKGTKTVFLAANNFDFKTPNQVNFLKTVTTGGSLLRGEGRNVTGSGITETGNYLYYFFSAGTPDRYGYLDNFKSTGIRYGAAAQYTATANYGTGGTATVSSGTVSAGGSVTFTAIPDANYSLSGWSGDCSGDSASIVLSNINSNVSCMANFTRTWVNAFSMPSDVTLRKYFKDLGPMGWSDANNTCAALGGRLPNENFGSEIDEAQYNREDANACYWTSRTSLPDLASAWIKSYGDYHLTSLSSSCKARCVNNLPSWKSSAYVSGISVYTVDSGSNLKWKNTNTSCVSPQCNSSNILTGDNSVNFSDYPARDACKAIGGRLPTRTELIDIIQANIAHPGTFGIFSGTYWTSEEYDVDEARVVTEAGIANKWLKNFGTFKTRCVK